MARNGSTKKKAVTYQGFANVSLTKQRKLDIKKLAEESPDYDKWIENLCSDGYKVSITWIDDPGYYSATAYQTKEDSDHAGWGTTARHADLGTVIATLNYYVYSVLNEEGWPEQTNNYEW